MKLNTLFTLALSSSFLLCNAISLAVKIVYGSIPYCFKIVIKSSIFKLNNCLNPSVSFYSVIVLSIDWFNEISVFSLANTFDPIEIDGVIETTKSDVSNTNFYLKICILPIILFVLYDDTTVN